jgi:hypothetical protein
MIDYGHHPYPPAIEARTFNYIYDSGGMADPSFEYSDHKRTTTELEAAIGTLLDIAKGTRYHDDWGEQVGGYSGIDVHTSEEDIASATRSVGNAALNLHLQQDASRDYTRFFLPQLRAQANLEMHAAMHVDVPSQ